jgi:hypothetical protein
MQSFVWDAYRVSNRVEKLAHLDAPTPSTDCMKPQKRDCLIESLLYRQFRCGWYGCHQSRQVRIIGVITSSALNEEG